VTATDKGEPAMSSSVIVKHLHTAGDCNG